MKKIILLLSVSFLSLSAMAQQPKIDPPVMKPAIQPVVFTLKFSPQELQILGQIIDNSNAPHSNVVAITALINKQLAEQAPPPTPAPADKKEEKKEDAKTEPEKK